MLRKSAVLLYGCLVLAGGCAGITARTGPAAIAVQTEALQATSNAEADKEGKSCSRNILGIVAVGDSSISTAKLNAGITKVASVDYKVLNVLVFYGHICTIVRGT